MNEDEEDWGYENVFEFDSWLLIIGSNVLILSAIIVFFKEFPFGILIGLIYLVLNIYFIFTYVRTLKPESDAQWRKNCK